MSAENKYFTCEECGEIFLIDDAIETHNHNLICQSCYTDNYFTCEDCEDVFQKNDAISVNGNLVCEDCYDANYFTCEECGEIFLIDDAIETHNHNFICQSCYTDNYFTCEDCEEIFQRSNAIEISNHTSICQSCYIDNYFSCEECNEVFHIDDAMSVDNTFICRNCYEDEEEKESKIIHEYHQNKPSTTFFDFQNNYKNIGIEFEIDKKNKDEDYHLDDFATILQTKFPTDFVYFEKDSSVSNGFEIITQPAAIEFLLKIDWKNILEYCKENEFLGHDAKNAGIHINIDKRFFDTNKTYRLLHIFKIFFNEIAKFSRRTVSQINNYCKNYDFKENDILEILEGKDNDKFRSVNLTKNYAIEIRIFRSTLIENSFVSILHFTNRLLQILEDETIILDATENPQQQFETLFINDNEILKEYWDKVKNRSL